VLKTRQIRAFAAGFLCVEEEHQNDFLLCREKYNISANPGYFALLFKHTSV